MNPEGPPRTRREVLRDAVASAVGTATGFGALLEIGDDVRRTGGRFLEKLRERRKLLSRERGWESLTKEEREAVVATEVRDFKSYLTLEGDSILSNEHSSDEEVFGVLRAMPWYTHRQLAGTKYDFPPREWPTVSLSRRFAPKGAADSIAVDRLDGKGNPSHGGNGTWVRMPDGKLSLLTNIHVLSHVVRADRIIDATAFAEVRSDEDIDAVFVRFTDEYIQELAGKQAIPAEFLLDAVPDDDAVHGALVRFPAIDKDDTSMPDGRKLYTSVVVRLTPRLRIFLLKHVGWDFSPDVNFIYISPPGEERNLDTDRRGFLRRLLHKTQGVTVMTRWHSYGQGTSGTAAILASEKGGTLGGINWGVGGQVVRGADVLDLGVMNGPEVLRAAARHGLVLDMHNPPLVESKEVAPNSEAELDYGGQMFEEGSSWFEAQQSKR